MTTQHEITGFGPVRPDGSVLVYTSRPNPFAVSASWLAAQGKPLAVGEFIELNDQGALTLVTEAQAKADEAKEQPTADGAPASAPSPFAKYSLNPIVVTAAEITAVTAGESHTYVCHFADGTAKETHESMEIEGGPIAGDYWIIEDFDGIQEDHIVVKAHFLRAFTPVQE